MTSIENSLTNQKRDLLKLLLNKKGINLQTETILPRPNSEPAPLSFGQEQLWFLSQIQDNTTYNLPLALQISGSLNISVLEQVITEIVRRHEILRTNFQQIEGKNLQVIRPEINISLQVINLDQITAKQQLQNVERLINQETDKIFNLSEDDLFQSTLYQLNQNSYILLLNMHHIISDGWSIGILLQELSTLYGAYLAGNKSPLPDLQIQYADYAIWQKEKFTSEIREKQLNYWKQQLADIPPLLELPTDKPRPPIQSFRGGIWEFSINSNLSQKIRTLTQQSDATLFMTMLAAFVILLYRCSGQDDILIGSPMAGRNRQEIQSLIGYFVNTVVLRTKLTGNPNFREILNQVRQVATDAHNYQDIPYNQVVEALNPQRNLSYNPVFQILFDLQHSLTDKLQLPGLTLQPFLGEHSISKFDLSLIIEDRGTELIGAWEYSSDLFTQETISRITENFQTLLNGIVNNPETPINQLPIISAFEQQQILEKWNNTQQDYPESFCIHELLTQQVIKTPDAIAVKFGNQQLTYTQLNQKANQLANYLQNCGVTSEVLVGLYLERSLDILIAILAILKAGGAYLPLDPKYPQTRLTDILNDSQVSIILTQEKLLTSLSSPLPRGETPLTPYQGKIILLDTDLTIISQQNIETPISAIKPDNLAYVIYTSGSTGKPKGVMITHQNIVNHATSIIDKYQINSHDRILQFTTFIFDVAAEEIFPAWLSGATLIICPQEMVTNLIEFSQFLAQESLTVVNLPTPYWQEWVLEIDRKISQIPDSLRLVITGSDQVLPEKLALWQKLVTEKRQNIQWINAYGLTETTITSTVYQLPVNYQLNTTHSVPIGRPIANTEIYILDQNLQPVPIGIPGELHIGGAGLARGYLNRKQLTNEKFISNPISSSKSSRLYKTGDLARYLPDGNIEFLGRIDYQVKIRGFRIELGEIEAVLAQHPLVKSSAVIVREIQPGNKQLVAYVVTEDHSNIQQDLRSFLKQNLPDYMLPAFFVRLAELPLTPTGKINRRALSALMLELNHETDYILPRNPLEQKLAEIWCQVLGLEKVSVEENFFNLGGHSLATIQIISRIRETLKIDLPLQYLFTEPTIAGLTKIINQLLQTADHITPIDDFYVDVILDSSIKPQNLPQQFTNQLQHILLTGATGFLGVHLLHELLEKTSANIHCLVRAENVSEARNKLKNKLSFYQLWNEQHSQRIIPIIGNLEKNLLGLSEKKFQDLASQIDAIYHNGASVNLIYPYSVLKPANVLGTQEILRLASQIKIKPVHFVSTTSVFCPENYPENEVLLESDPLDYYQGLVGGYPQSKWVAEKLVMQARERGLPVTIYRAARIIGHSQIGICNTEDLFSRIITTCMQLGATPNIDWEDNLTPVDYVSQAIVYLSFQKESLGKAFHLLNPQIISMNHLFNLIRKLGYQLPQISYDQWYYQLINLMQKSADKKLEIMSAFFPPTSQQKIPEPKFDYQNTVKGLFGANINCPPINENLLSQYFKNDNFIYSK
ncbi:amino acid adenylation domain-containing protein [Aphanizomenon flos-aquae NRERC-008]|uniref:Amino acid adenylation domain-containing protein n=1 Tax=Aphanizomenon flos-aquae FACHB-1249 TaxID=2692889 RepID=A0ABR8IRF7_APHFL|nr:MULTISPECIES: non-ribosomal peptide synthetase [Aphanizomenon]MBD2389846.1 amino acid adenylation domain-containing protein [Aphanizomenon flos-aquae FACHB-1171]MBD2556770.1 amino acid adenylation domain-containing protein [Aphanizomenon flos-aquae FACHB-1290]MBD2631214.1 amino acid adenylation domain-containing protein [Aphanizomenon sp. FACHB-1399]MBD2642345.1 amino acid adenylation domain-containing protein [Aphanizomenon sp. FACHB-1401]MBD2656914.1 amino acid adenylation domain-containi